MAKPNLSQMTKPEIIRLSKYRCKHGHTGLAHYACYLTEKKVPERVGFLDIESSGFSPPFDIVVSYCIKLLGSSKVLSGLVTPEDLAKDEPDERILKDCIRDMRTFDRLVGFYSKDYRFDIPFLRTRAEICQLDFPKYGEILFVDVYDMAKKKLKLRSNRQANVCRVLTGEAQRTYMEPKVWRKAVMGRNRKCLQTIHVHNIADVKDLEVIYKRLVGYVRTSNTSL